MYEHVLMYNIIPSIFPYLCFRSVDITGVSNCQRLNVSRIESVCTNINPEFGMYHEQLSSDSESDASESTESRSVQ